MTDDPASGIAIQCLRLSKKRAFVLKEKRNENLFCRRISDANEL